jgi:hypothetical protein
MRFSLHLADGGGICWSPDLCLCSFNTAVAFAARKNSTSKNRDCEHSWLGGYLHDSPLALTDRRKWYATEGWLL